MDEDLVALVRLKPMLYDPSRKEYRNTNTRKEVWDEIGEKLGISGDECKESWTKLRNAYIQALKRRSVKSGQAAKNMGKWKFEDEMSFLNPFLEIKRNRCDDGTDDGSTPLLDEDGVDFQLPEDPQLTQSEPVVVPYVIKTSNLASSNHRFSKSTNHLAHPSPRKRSRSSVERMISVMKDNNRHLAEHLRCPSAAVRTDLCDDCDLFFLSLAKSVKKLSPEEQVRVKLEVGKVVFRAGLRTPQNSEEVSVHPDVSSHYVP